MWKVKFIYGSYWKLCYDRMRWWFHMFCGHFFWCLRLCLHLILIQSRSHGQKPRMLLIAAFLEIAPILLAKTLRAMICLSSQIYFQLMVLFTRIAIYMLCSMLSFSWPFLRYGLLDFRTPKPTYCIVPSRKLATTAFEEIAKGSGKRFLKDATGHVEVTPFVSTDKLKPHFQQRITSKEITVLGDLKKLWSIFWQRRWKKKNPITTLFDCRRWHFIIKKNWWVIFFGW